MKNNKKGRWFRPLYGLMLVAFTVYTLLDTFVLSTSYASVEDASAANITFSSISTSSTSSSEEEDTTESSTGDSTGDSDGTTLDGVYADAQVIDSYTDDNIAITIYQFYENDTYIYAADVQVTSVEYLKSAFAEDTYGKNVTAKTSEIAESVDAILAINGDYYGAQESGYVIRNGVIYRDSADAGDQVLCIYTDGSMETVNADDYTAQELLDAGVWQAYSFGPALISDGEITVTTSDEVGKAMASNPRTAIGMYEAGHYVFVVSDGRTSESEGLSLYELAEFMDSLGCAESYNLDGGGSSTMVFQGQVINKPTTSGNRISERSVSDIVYVG